MNWRNFVEESHAKAFKLPPGWDSKEKIADDLECAPDSVRRLLAPAIKAGSIDSNVFPVWCHVTKKIVRVTAYRKALPKPKKPDSKPLGGK
jgi:hypothetical protein